MCWFHSPRHSWCNCTDPGARDKKGKLLCPHHIHLRDDIGPVVAFNYPQRKAIKEAVRAVPPASASWVHCSSYRNVFAQAGYETLCPKTISDGPHGHRTYFECDGLCEHCCEPGQPGVAMQLVPLRERKGTDAIVLSNAGRGWQEVIARTAYCLLDGNELDPELYERIWQSEHSRHGDGKGVYVDVVDRRIGGRWQIVPEESVVYLIPRDVSERPKPSFVEVTAKEAAKVAAAGWKGIKELTKAASGYVMTKL
ncbi:hypothetical protein MFIFM68171_05433 [Madurella fahalii]|uniref:Uncharacterized protein n=1 Tax=Madurella fahalii TaxID=1157608 RepID=A0ABQ0GBS7_9PEZI